MRTAIAILVVLGSVGAAGAQTVVDGSDSKVPKAMWEASKAEMGRILADPLGAQVRGLKVAANPKMDGGICGEVNAKNRVGAYTGFVPFGYIPTMKRPLQVVGTGPNPELEGVLSRILQSLCSDETR